MNDKAKEIFEEIKNNQKILLHLHVNSDFDSVASNLALKKVLTKLEKDVEIYNSIGKPPEVCSFLEGFNTIKNLPLDNVDLKKFDLMISCDSSNEERIGINDLSKLEDIKIIVLDHHKANTKFGDINLIDSSVSSASELLYWLFKEWQIDLNKELLEILFVGIWGDTSGFTNNLMKPSTFEALSEMYPKGIDPSKISSHLSITSNNILMAAGEVLSNLEEFSSGRLLVATVTKDISDKYEIPGGITTLYKIIGGLIDKSKDTYITAVVYEIDKNSSGFSFRSNNPYHEVDVRVLAQRFGGNGHIKASGADVQLPIVEAKRLLVKEAVNYLK